MYYAYMNNYIPPAHWWLNYYRFNNKKNGGDRTVLAAPEYLYKVEINTF